MKKYDKMYVKRSLYTHNYIILDFKYLFVGFEIFYYFYIFIFVYIEILSEKNKKLIF